MEYVKTAPNNIKKVAFAAVSFTALFTGYIAAQNVASTVYKTVGYDKLGETCVLFIYLGLGLGSIVAAYIKQKLTHRAAFMIGALFYAGVVIAGLLTSTCQENKDAFYCSNTAARTINIIFSMLAGFGGSIMWLTQSDYVNTAATQETKGTYNGLFWTIMQLSQILSSVLVTILLPIGATKLYCVLMGFVVLAVFMFSFTPKLPATAEVSAKYDESFATTIKKFSGAFTAKKSFFLLPAMILTGVAVSFYANFLTKVNRAIPLSDDVNKDDVDSSYSARLGYILMALAIGEIAAGLIVGKLADKYNKVKVYHVMLLVPEIALILTAIAYFTSNYYVLVISGFMWGFTDTGLNSILGILIGSYFGGKMEYFCLMRFFAGFGAMAGSLLALVCTEILTFGGITAAAIVVLHIAFVLTKDDNINNKQEIEEPLTAATESEV